MKVYFASQSFYPHIGGVSTYLVNLLKEIRKRGNQVVELHLRASNAPVSEVIEGIEVKRVPKEPIDKQMLRKYSMFKEAIYKECHGFKGTFDRPAIEMPGYDSFIDINDAFGIEVKDTLVKNPPDIIHIHDFQLIYLYRYVPRGIPLIFTWHIPLSKKISAHLKNFLSKHLNEYDKVIFSSQEYIDSAISIGVRKEKCELIYPLCNTELFRKIEVSKEKIFDKYKIPQNAKVILCVQRIDPKSGHEQLISAMPEIIKKDPDARLVFVGSTSLSNKLSDERKTYTDKINELVKKLDMQKYVLFLGNVDYKELPSLYNCADIVTLCSKIEGFGLAITEGMACGKPVVATNAGGIPLQVKNSENGFLVQPGDVKATSEKITILLKDPELRNKFGEKSLEIVEKNFKMEFNVEKHIHLYNSLLNYKLESRQVEKLNINNVDALITDYDRTLTDKPGELKQETVDRLSALDTTHILVTGRTFDYCKTLYNRFKLWDCIVCENGAVVYFPKSKKTVTVYSEYIGKAKKILEHGKIPVYYGNVIIKSNLKHAPRIKSILHRIDKNINYITNFNNIMLLPKYVNKSSGIRIALDYLGIESERTVIIGDAENDLDLFTIPAFKVAVANAHPRLKMVADYVTKSPSSKGVFEVADMLLKASEQNEQK